ncbi:MAG: hypothetical protein QCH99_09820 [Candidatus Bathyarchaeota archaeon]|nr:hypothetical protein [Candidatus Bathyarchaeum tardum]
MVLGRFDSFPKNVHNVAVFNCQDPETKVQQAIVCSFQRLNQLTFELNQLISFLKQDYKVSFEVGIADGSDFMFLNQNELEHALKAVEKNELEVLDFFVVVRYHRINEKGKQIPLRFDYHVLRFAFHEKLLELLIRHERGTQRVPIEDIIEFFTNQINIELKKRQLSPLNKD